MKNYMQKIQYIFNVYNFIFLLNAFREHVCNLVVKLYLSHFLFLYIIVIFFIFLCTVFVLFCQKIERGYRSLKTILQVLLNQNYVKRLDLVQHKVLLVHGQTERNLLYQMGKDLLDIRYDIGTNEFFDFWGRFFFHIMSP